MQTWSRLISSPEWWKPFSLTSSLLHSILLAADNVVSLYFLLATRAAPLVLYLGSGLELHWNLWSPTDDGHTIAAHIRAQRHGRAVASRTDAKIKLIMVCLPVVGLILVPRSRGMMRWTSVKASAPAWPLLYIAHSLCHNSWWVLKLPVITNWFARLSIALTSGKSQFHTAMWNV